MLPVHRNLLQCLLQRFSFSLLFLFHQELCVLGSRVVDAALGLLLTLPPPSPFIFSFFHRLGRVPVTHTLVTSVKELVVWDIVRLDVLLHLLEWPIGQRINLDQTSLINLNDVEVASFAALTSPSASDDCRDLQFSVCSLRRLNFGQVVVQLVICFPQPVTVFLRELFRRFGALRFERVNCDKRIS